MISRSTVLASSKRFSSASVSTSLSTLRGSRLARTYASSASAKETVNIVEVGPRDGLQNEKVVIPVETKVELVNRLARAGSKIIEAGSFVSPKWTPQVWLLYQIRMATNN
jgi:hydroxymethylglutaryl-CoA lyase